MFRTKMFSSVNIFVFVPSYLSHTSQSLRLITVTLFKIHVYKVTMLLHVHVHVQHFLGYLHVQETPIC